MARVLVTIIVLAVLGVIGATGFVYSGMYNVAAADQHKAPVFWVLKTTMRRAVERHSHSVVVPPLDDPTQIARGRVLFVTHCSRCHGAPGVAPEPFALGLRPAPANLANTALEWVPAQLYWAITNGLKLTGMPAWEFRLTDDEIWSIVAYVRRMPYEAPRRFREALVASGLSTPSTPPPQFAPTTHDALGQAMGGDPDRGRYVLLQYGCITCHDIPGVVGAAIPVGPPLDGMALRSFIGGVMPNSAENMVRWLLAPQQFVPDGAMPNLGVTERDARDMAAYLESLR
ncbi:MAG TPA: c-type cytochrome [Casimicrobiaceae bacterium]